MNKLSFSRRLDWLCQTNLPSEVFAAVREYDKCISDTIYAALAINPDSPDLARNPSSEPDFSRKRIFSPVRHKGLGIVLLEDRLHAIFASTMMSRMHHSQKSSLPPRRRLCSPKAHQGCDCPPGAAGGCPPRRGASTDPLHYMRDSAHPELAPLQRR